MYTKIELSFLFMLLFCNVIFATDSPPSYQDSEAECAVVLDTLLQINVFENNATCIGAENGSIQIVSCGLSLPQQYTYTLTFDDGTQIANELFEFSNFTIDNLKAGAYTFVVLDDMADTIFQEVVVVGDMIGSVFEILRVTTVNATSGLSLGEISIELVGGLADYTYSWTGPSAGNDISSNNTLEIFNLPPGLYSFTINDVNGNLIQQDISVLGTTNPQQSCDQPFDIIIMNDVSSSVDPIEYQQSKIFFSNLSAVLNVGSGPNDSKIAIAEWSDNQDIQIPLTGDLSNLSNYPNNTRLFDGGTNPNSALTFGKNYLEANGRPGVLKIIILSTDSQRGKLSNSLIALAEQYKAEGFIIATIAFDEAFTTNSTRTILNQVATIDQLAPGANQYSELDATLALYICALDPGEANTIYFNRDAVLEIDNYVLDGICPNPESVTIEYTISANQQLALPAGTPITFYLNDPSLFSATKIITTELPCALETGTSVTLTTTLPINGAANIYAVVNDDGATSLPLSLPVTDINEIIFTNNIDFVSICVDQEPTVSVNKYTTTPVPICDNTVIYTIDVCNISEFPLVAVSVIDEVPDGFDLLTQSIENNGCATGTTNFNIPVGCCVSIISSYDATNATNGFYNNQNTVLSGPAGQIYYNYDGILSDEEDVLIEGNVDCPSDRVNFALNVNGFNVCDDQFLTCTFQIENTTNLALQNISFQANTPAPSVWASEPYFLNDLSISNTNITGTNAASFNIAEIPAASVGTFSIDIYLGDWEDFTTINIFATIAQLPDFVNGNIGNIFITSTPVTINGGPNMVTDLEVTITEGDPANLTLSVMNGQNPVWTTFGDGFFDLPNSLSPSYFPGPQDIANGYVEISVSTQNIDPACTDKVVGVTIIIEPAACAPVVITETQEYCIGQTVTIFNQQVSSDVMLEEMYITAEGCDSTHQISVVFDAELMTSETQNYCEGETAMIFGNPVLQSGQFENLFISQSGCDSTHQINVEFNANQATSETQNYCQGQTALIFGNPISQTGQFDKTFTSQTGCDSTHTINAVFSSSVFESETQQFCDGETLMIYGNLVSETGTFQEVFIGQNGCDSIHQINVVFNSILMVTETQNFCEGETAMIFGNPILESGVFEETYNSQDGCDSTHTINVVFNTNSFGMETQEFCTGETVIIYGNSVSIDGEFSTTFISENGCDSIHQINAVFTAAQITSETQNYCEGETVLIMGEEVFENGLISKTFTTNAGCDSTHEVQALFFESPINTVTYEFCTGEEFTLNGTTYTQDATVEQAFTTTNGCDSIVETMLFFQEDIEVKFDEIICHDEVFVFFGDTIKHSGTYTQEIFSLSMGCDTIQIVTVNRLPALEMSLIDTLMAYKDEPFLLPLFTTAFDITYLWSNADLLSCDDCRQPIGTISSAQNFTITISNNEGCELTKSIYVIVEEKPATYVPNIFSPNEDGINDYFNLFTNQVGIEILQMTIFDRWGSILYVDKDITANNEFSGWNGTHKNKLLNPGVYIYQFVTRNINGQQEVITGDVFLMH